MVRLSAAVLCNVHITAVANQLLFPFSGAVPHGPQAQRHGAPLAGKQGTNPPRALLPRHSCLHHERVRHRPAPPSRRHKGQPEELCVAYQSSGEPWRRLPDAKRSEKERWGRRRGVVGSRGCDAYAAAAGRREYKVCECVQEILCGYVICTQLFEVVRESRKSSKKESSIK
jgi:hypothetical protein